MLKSGEFWLLNAIGALALVLVAMNMILVHGNRGMQATADRRAQYVQQSAQLQGLYQGIVRTIANLSVRDKDAALKNVLTQEGITVSVSAAAPAAATQAGKRSRP
ncbi:MAG TPA: hypothetical protein VNE59_00640 [Burkholderiales bacterium]|nr:hypothetical protein [Burkholderiales bacterium]